MVRPLQEMDTEELRRIAVRGGIEGTEAMDREELVDALVARPGEGAWQEDPKPADVNPNDYQYHGPEQR
ncbi:hypothetical protein E1091_12935 [Micromonospora fluostatini]|uniref:Rho termination factor N-terminal domain-containing protein n=2 Tax=Micromonospora TaxID=1873 RepID=A0A136PPR9_9ACTN|nr:hypothetical protein [Micromonospora rosaria]KXK60465.1 hypothetical protein AWW66_18590 [Micromonospora rosaria]TDB92444.1 hypothetical protein E1091_12935 [Micromonospora fluostatini]